MDLDDSQIINLAESFHSWYIYAILITHEFSHDQHLLFNASTTVGILDLIYFLYWAINYFSCKWNIDVLTVTVMLYFDILWFSLFYFVFQRVTVPILPTPTTSSSTTINTVDNGDHPNVMVSKKCYISLFVDHDHSKTVLVPRIYIYMCVCVCVCVRLLIIIILIHTQNLPCHVQLTI